MDLPHWNGWHLIGAYPDHEPDDVGSWLLYHGGAAFLLEVPEGLPVADGRAALGCIGASPRFVTTSHDHEDHRDASVWQVLKRCFPEAEFIHPASVPGDRLLHLGDEPLWLIRAPKHSTTDVVTVFRGVAMTGDIELGMLASVNDEVPCRTKERRMSRLRDVESRAGYTVHSIVSAHLDDVRTGVNWQDLFECRDAVRPSSAD